MAQAMADLLIESREEIFAAVGKSEDSKISRQKKVA
jgi:hypothetical protein